MLQDSKFPGKEEPGERLCARPVALALLGGP